MQGVNRTAFHIIKYDKRVTGDFFFTSGVIFALQGIAGAILL